MLSSEQTLRAVREKLQSRDSAKWEKSIIVFVEEPTRGHRGKRSETRRAEINWTENVIWLHAIGARTLDWRVLWLSCCLFRRNFSCSRCTDDEHPFSARALHSGKVSPPTAHPAKLHCRHKFIFVVSQMSPAFRIHKLVSLVFACS